MSSRGAGPKLAATIAIGLFALFAQTAVAQQFSASTVQSPPNPVDAGTRVTYTTTVTNTGADPYPGEFRDDSFLSMFLSRYRSDKFAPNFYESVTPSQGTCTRHETRPPSIDCTLGSLDPGASATYTAVLVAQVSIENRIAVLHCTSVNDCGTLALADADTIVKKSCVVPGVVARLLASAKHVLRKANCGVGTVTRRHARRARRGRVLSQRPAAGTKLGVGAPVALVVGKR